MIAKLKTDCKNICIVLHQNPDGDALCAAKAINLIYKKYWPDKKVFLINDFSTSVKLKYPKVNDKLPRWIQTENLPDDTFLLFLDHSDFYYTLFNSWAFDDKRIKHKLVIDHHFCYNERFKLDELFIDIQAFSTCEIIYDLATRTEGFEFDKDIALALYLGIFSDSCYHSTPLKPALLRKINHLLDYCQDVVEKYQYYKKGRWYKQMKQMGYIAQKCTSKLGGFAPVVRLRIGNKEWENLHKESLRLTSIISDLLNLRQVDHLVCMYEYKEGEWGVMLRTNNTYALRMLQEKLKHPYAYTRIKLTKEKAKRMADYFERKLAKMPVDGLSEMELIEEFERFE